MGSVYDIRGGLKTIRKKAGLSQRVVSERTGIQQAQLSRIENQSADPRLSSIVALSRALEYELVLIPRALLERVEQLIRSDGKDRVSVDTAIPAYRLDEEDDDE